MAVPESHSWCSTLWLFIAPSTEMMLVSCVDLHPASESSYVFWLWKSFVESTFLGIRPYNLWTDNFTSFQLDASPLTCSVALASPRCLATVQASTLAHLGKLLHFSSGCAFTVGIIMVAFMLRWFPLVSNSGVLITKGRFYQMSLLDNRNVVLGSGLYLCPAISSCWVQLFLFIFFWFQLSAFFLTVPPCPQCPLKAPGEVVIVPFYLWALILSFIMFLWVYWSL